MKLKTTVQKEVFFLLFLILIFSVLTIWVRTTTVRDTYVYIQQEKEIRRLEQEIQAVRVQWLKLTAPKRLEEVAKQHGLERPAINQVMRYSFNQDNKK